MGVLEEVHRGERPYFSGPLVGLPICVRRIDDRWDRSGLLARFPRWFSFCGVGGVGLRPPGRDGCDPRSSRTRYPTDRSLGGVGDPEGTRSRGRGRGDRMNEASDTDEGVSVDISGTASTAA